MVYAALLCLCNLGRYYANAAAHRPAGPLRRPVMSPSPSFPPDAALITAAARLFNILAHTHPTDLDRLLDGGVAPALDQDGAWVPRGVPDQGCVQPPLTAGAHAAVVQQRDAPPRWARQSGGGRHRAAAGAGCAQRMTLSYFVDAFPALSVAVSATRATRRCMSAGGVRPCWRTALSRRPS